MTQERRRVPRFRLDAEIAVNDSAGRTVNLSANSVYFVTAKRFSAGETVALVLPFEHVQPGAAVECTAHIVRVDRRGELFGVAATYEPVAFSVTAPPPA